MKRPLSGAVACALLALWCPSAFAAGQTIDLTLQTRDPKSGEVKVAREKVDPARIGVVIIDPWDYHWCMTAAQRVGALVPRMNKALQCDRKLGMQVIWCPTDVASQYVGTPQRERAMAVPYVPVPKVRDLVWRGTLGGGCMCGPGITCRVNYGWDGIAPDLVIADRDLIASGLEELYSICKQKGLTHLIYMGVHTNMCVLGKPPALRNMYTAGLSCMLARDITDACTWYDPKTGFTPDKGTARVVADIEKSGIPTINMVRELARAGLWDEHWLVDPVRLAPWGTKERPYEFTDSFVLTPSAPWQKDAEIRYTTDGSPPQADSKLYKRPLTVSETTELRAVAMRGGKPAGLPSRGYFVKLPPAPPEPDVLLSDIQPRKRTYADYWHWLPKLNQSFGGGPLSIRGARYRWGMGMRAPANACYDLKPEYDRFVALAGVDDAMLADHNGRMMAMHASVVFQVFLDGRLAAESPVMRISQEPWRFDVKIPDGARRIDLVATDAGSRSPYDLANWAMAGFIRKGSAGRPPTVLVPGYWEQDGRYAGYDGFAWYRCFVKVPASWAGKDLTLNVPAVDNSHESYFNGQKVGGAGRMPPHYQNGLDTEKPCTVPARLVRPGRENLLAIRVYDAGGAGGFRDGPPVLSLGKEAIRLQGRWLFATGDRPDWARWPEREPPPKEVIFSKVSPLR
jgi:hypothetical protein